MKKQTLTLGLVALLGMVGMTGAGEFSEGFESYVSGNNIHGLGGWKGWDNVPGAGAFVSNLHARKGGNSVEIASTSDLVHEFSLFEGKWVLTAWQYISSLGQGTTYFILLNTYQDGGSKDWSAQTQYNLTTGTITPWRGVTGVDAQIIYDQWVQIRFVIDLTENTFEEYYNGAQIAAGEWDDDVHGTLQAIDLYGNGASSVYYDDIRIHDGTVPVTGQYFPRPAYDSGWIATPFGSPIDFFTRTLTHGLGGNVDDYVVDLQMRVSGIAGPNLSNLGLGSVYSYNFLNAQRINVTAPFSAVDLVTNVRVRIWVYGCDTEADPGGGPDPQ